MSGQMSDALEAMRAAEIIPARAPNLAVAALYYVERLGWPVFPLKPRGKTPLFPVAHSDKEVQAKCKRACGEDGHGLYDATTDVERVKAWWTAHPDSNIGLRTGVAFDAIDADGPEGVEAWQKIKHRHCNGCSKEAFCGATGGFTIIAEAFTPGNSAVGRGPGRHILVPVAAGRSNNGGRKAGQPPIDYRGAGGYIVGVPSLNFVGATYGWVTPPAVPQ